MEYKALLKNDTVLEDPCIRIENCSGATSSIIIPMGHRYVSIWPAFLFTIKKRSFEAGIVKLAFILQRFYLLRIYVCVCGFVCVYIYIEYQYSTSGTQKCKSLTRNAASRL